MESITHTTKMPDVPSEFAAAVVAGIEGILQRQQPSGAIIYDPAAPEIYPQQSILPLAFCWAGLDPSRRYHRDPRLATAITRLGDYLLERMTAHGEYHFDSHGYQVKCVDERLIYAWTEALRIVRDAGGDFPFDQWGERIMAACQRLIDNSLRRLVGLRRFTVRELNTGTNHFALYLTAVYRAGQVLGRPDLCEIALPLARALAHDMHPDGYWDEHSDLQRSGGPTPLYNYLTLCAMGLMAEWTGEEIFCRTAEKAVDFYCNFNYPDGNPLDLIDERVRYVASPRDPYIFYDRPMIWALFAFSRTPAGRSAAARHLQGWLRWPGNKEHASPEALARHCENFMYWHPGEPGVVPIDRPDHQALMTLPAGLFRSGPWCVGLSCMRATTPEDPAYRENPFALERQKLFSIWHERTGVLVDGSHSKHQPENSTFWAHPKQADDYWPLGGTVQAESGSFVARAVFKTFQGTVRLTPLNERVMQVEFEVDSPASMEPVTAAFTVQPLASAITGVSNQIRQLAAETWSVSGEELGGSFQLGSVKLSGPSSMQVSWPMSPYNCYAVDHRSSTRAWLLRVSVALTHDQPRAKFLLEITGSSEEESPAT